MITSENLTKNIHAKVVGGQAQEILKWRSVIMN